MAEWGLWIAALVLLTGAMAAVRGELGQAHVALGYLLLVLAGSARGSRLRGLVLALLAFCCFNFFFLPPFGTFVIHDPLDWIVLLTFLAVASVATQLLYRARHEADVARRRADEVERLSALGAETLNAARVEDALVAIAEVIRGTLALDRCEIFLPGPGGELVAAGDETEPAHPAPASVVLAAEHGTGVVERIDGTLRLLPGSDAEVPHVAEAAAASLPLRVRERLVGVLRIRRGSGLVVDAAQRRFFTALAYYAALGAERARLTAEVRHAEALREADRLKDALLAAVSHDLRTPLTTIKALAHDIAGEGDVRAIDIEEQADRLNRMVADLLDLSRLNAGALPLRPEIVAAEDLVGAALQSVDGALAGRAVETTLGPGDPILLGRFDLVHSLRVLVNLLENAHKYSPPGSAIELTAEQEGDRLVFRVADRGPGIAPERRDGLFEPFQRSGGQAPDAGGAGLGLSISRRLAEAQEGSLRHEPRPGGGSVFVFSLPAVHPGSISL